MSNNTIENTVIKNDILDDYEIINMSRIIGIAKGTITENISDMEMEFAKVLMLGYEMGIQDVINNVESKIESSVNDMKNNVENQEINIEVNVNEKE